jgi:hypothetical protein
MLRAPQVRRAVRSSKVKFVHIIRVTHRDEVEPPITDWLREAYELPEKLAAKVGRPSSGSRTKKKTLGSSGTRAKKTTGRKKVSRRPRKS